MTRFVALSTDANSSYAIYAPIVTRLWRHLGYEPLLVCSPRDDWKTPFGEFVFSQIDGCIEAHIPALAPLSLGDTMRVARLAVCASTVPAHDDLIMTSDIDMAPLSRAFFNRTGPAFVLRADAYGSLNAFARQLANDPGTLALLPLHMRFPLCYVGLASGLWRDIMPYVRGLSIEILLKRILHGVDACAGQFDEAYLTRRLLSSRWAAGQLEAGLVDTMPWHRQGAFEFFSTGARCPQRMLLREAGAVYDPDAIDWHLPRPPKLWVGEALARYWPEGRTFLESYWPKACELAGVR